MDPASNQGSYILSLSFDPGRMVRSADLSQIRTVRDASDNKWMRQKQRRPQLIMKGNKAEHVAC